MTEDPGSTKEVAEATKSVAEFSSKLLDFFTRACGDIVEDTFGIFADKVRAYRTKKQLEFVTEIENDCRMRGFVIEKKIPLRLAWPIVVHGAEEDNESLRNMWKRLFVNALDPSQASEIRKAFVSILQDLEPLDVILLDKLVKTTVFERTTTQYPAVTAKNVSQALVLDIRDVEAALDNLDRQGLASKYPLSGGVISDSSWTFGKGGYRCTELGLRLWCACSEEARSLELAREAQSKYRSEQEGMEEGKTS